MNWQPVLAEARNYNAFLHAHGSPIHQERWRQAYESSVLTDSQRRLIAGFTRQMKVLCLAGTWCGDFVNQCPILQRFAEANPLIELRFLDRDVNLVVRSELMVNGGQRVPVVVFLSEDFHECARFGDRTLSTYRQMAADQLGPASCPTGVTPADRTTIQMVTQEWLNEFERIQLMLRLSPRFRQMYGD